MSDVKAKELGTDPEFKASLGWYNNWKCRHSISMRTKTTLAQCLPADMEDKIVTFHRFVVRAWRCGEYPLSHIINMDETHRRGSSYQQHECSSLRGTRRCRSQSFTVALAVKVNGEKLPPKVIFKGIRKLRINVPQRIQVSVHKKGWMDEEGIYLFACLFSFCFVRYQITEHMLLSTYHMYANLTSLVGEFVYI